eukprot:CAMPEP_0180185410 /NCGR_PEP_ID=MMETSP0986-20121125/42376_1 /TAXON_ID=697907 /ORGANISM="non described non described, Strain CCMP2293" /LENGTH=33 /DNA_ID= /DNA_START= /DNA_END= /DNA_ORIENTATION=
MQAAHHVAWHVRLEAHVTLESDAMQLEPPVMLS